MGSLSVKNKSAASIGYTGGLTAVFTPQTARASKTASYASIPYEKFPKVTDSVPTKGLLPDYSTPETVWVA